MLRSSTQLRSDAQRIWWAGVRAAQAEQLIPQYVRVERDLLHVGDDAIDLRQVRRIAMVGAGKAAGAMAAAVEKALGPRLVDEKRLTGWVNVPADCIVPTERVRLHAARPAGVNEPRQEGVEGTRRIIELVGSLEADDLCLCVLSGGGSALLPAPVAEITLEDKIRVTQLLSAAGADIDQLNMVRRAISLVKGGGLARACRAGRLITLAISDVPGDRLETIASGPTVATSTSAGDALAVLGALDLLREPGMQSVVHYLRQRQHDEGRRTAPPAASDTQVTNLVIGNNAAAVDAAGSEAASLGYSPAMIAASHAEGPAEDVGRHLASMALEMRSNATIGSPDCLISGGEPTVRLVDPSRRGKGGRNQQLALAALAELGDCSGTALLAGGTDGEDGPTDAAGALITAEIVRAARRQKLDAADYLRRNDAHTFFAATDGLFITGPTQTNVCDLRVVTVENESRVRS